MAVLEVILNLQPTATTCLKVTWIYSPCAKIKHYTPATIPSA